MLLLLCTWEVVGGCLHPPQLPLPASTACAADFVETKRRYSSTNSWAGARGWPGLTWSGDTVAGGTLQPNWAGDGQAENPVPVGYGWLNKWECVLSCSGDPGCPALASCHAFPAGHLEGTMTRQEVQT